MSTPRKAKMRSPQVAVHVNCAAGENPGPPTFEAVAYSGGLIPGYTAIPKFDTDYVIDLAGMTASRNPIANLRHEDEQIVGHIPTVENTRQELKVAGVMSAATPYRDEVAKSAKDGFTWEVSQEADLSNIRKLAAGKSEVVNGQTVTGPLYIVRKSVFTGLAFVTHGADEGNSVSIAATAAGEPTMNEFEQWLVANEFDPDTMTVKQKATMQAAFDREKNGAAATAVPPTKLSALAEIERKEGERIDAITRMSKKLMEEYRGNAIAVSAIEEMGNKAIADKTEAKDFELELLRGARIQAGSFRTVSRQEPTARVMEAALCRAAGLPKYEELFPETVLEAVDSDPSLKHFSLQQFLMRAACSNGYDASPGERITTGNMKRVLRYALPEDDGPGRSMRATQFSTINLPGVFANVGNKELAAGFMEEDNTWREISRIVSATDFKLNTVYRLTDSLEYEILPPQGEIKHGQLGEETYTRQLKTYAKMLGLDRTAIINDDLSVFDDLRTRLGRGAARKFNNVFWPNFMANTSFYTSARVNLISGGTTNLGTDGVGLTAGVAAFKKLLSVDGKRIGGTPSILLIPPELEFIADRLYTGGNPNTQTVPNTNPFAGKYRPVVVPWLSDSNYSGYSTTAWYLLRDPSILAAMIVSFLNGQQQPTVDSAEADFNNLGILFRGYFDFSADLAEYLSGIRSNGA